MQPGYPAAPAVTIRTKDPPLSGPKILPGLSSVNDGLMDFLRFPEREDLHHDKDGEEDECRWIEDVEEDFARCPVHAISLACTRHQCGNDHFSIEHEQCYQHHPEQVSWPPHHDVVPPLDGFFEVPRHGARSLFIQRFSWRFFQGYALQIELQLHRCENLLGKGENRRSRHPLWKVH